MTSMRRPRVRDVTSRTRSFILCKILALMARFSSRVKVKPRNVRSQGLPTPLFAWLTRSLSSAKGIG
jgi:hypothetical protein